MTTTEAQFEALIDAFRTVAPVTLGITPDEAQERIAGAAQLVTEMGDDIFVDGDEYAPEEETWAGLMLGVTEDYSEWDADQIAEKCAVIANVPKPGGDYIDYTTHPGP